jgi:hypothetical protein
VLDVDVAMLFSVGLPAQVMRKYMNFSEESRLEVTQPEVVSFVMQKSEQLAGSIRCSAAGYR